MPGMLFESVALLGLTWANIVGEIKLKSHDLVNETPLYYAALSGDIATLQNLLDSGANLNYVDSRGDTVLSAYLAKSNARGDIVDMLVRAGAKPGDDGLGVGYSISGSTRQQHSLNSSRLSTNSSSSINTGINWSSNSSITSITNTSITSLINSRIGSISKISSSSAIDSISRMTSTNHGTNSLGNRQNIVEDWTRVVSNVIVGESFFVRNDNSSSSSSSYDLATVGGQSQLLWTAVAAVQDILEMAGVNLRSALGTVYRGYGKLAYLRDSYTSAVYSSSRRGNVTAAIEEDVNTALDTLKEVWGFVKQTDEI